ncbi:exonuclease 1 [Anaeramoeba flamelloides]|uniref:Exonuclease 1 n=1 Tax=Anaeramoeba flamelloides TaxID=1746091 RepID=A0ABQ8XMY7_9EUKA|nr:exonuclease 1 [Anaeramoeba flamelloides]
MQFINLLIKFGITPFVVFDGASLPMKLETQSSRTKTRLESFKKAQEFEKEGNMMEAKRFYQRSVRIRSKNAHDLLVELKKKNIRVLVAPYEADPQLAWLSMNGHVDAVLSVDSDLVVLGVKTFIHRWDNKGNAEQINRKDIWKIMPYVKDLATKKITFIGREKEKEQEKEKESEQEKKKENEKENEKEKEKEKGKEKGKKQETKKAKQITVPFDFRGWKEEKFIRMCVLSGCDFLSNIRGIGINRAFHFTNSAESISQVFELIKQDNRFTIPNGYIERFQLSLLTFLHQKVFDIVNKKLVPLRPYNPEISWDQDIENSEKDFSFLGPDIENEILIKISSGEFDPHTKKSFSEQNVINKTNENENVINKTNEKESEKEKENGNEKEKEEEKEKEQGNEKGNEKEKEEEKKKEKENEIGKEIEKEENKEEKEKENQTKTEIEKTSLDQEKEDSKENN